jgi:probable HAF family extracellular repeat protein
MGRKGLFVGFLSVVALAAHASGQIAYTVTDLGSGEANTINASGQVVGQTGGGDAFLYSNQIVQSLGFGDALGINDSGQVVGISQAFPSDPDYNAFLYSNGSFQTIGGNQYEAFGINDGGQIVGDIEHGSEAWIYSNGPFQDIGTGSAYAINNSGQVVGSAQLPGSGGNFIPFLYSNGTIQNLSNLLPSNYNGQGGSASAINNSGQVVGGYNGGGYLYSNGSVQIVAPTAAYGINDSGQVVGGASGSYAYLYSGGSAENLNSLIDPASGWTLERANAINDAGQIVGYGTLNGQTEAFLLNPYLVTTPTNRTPSLNLTTLNQPNPQTDFDVFNGTTFVPGGTLKANLPTIVLTHGFTENVAQWPTALADEIAGAGVSFNVVAWNWQNDATGTIGEATSRTYNEGMNLGEALLGELGPSYSQNIQFIGHSLGTLVNAEAINVFGDADAQAKIQDTLLDEAEIANQFSTSPYFAPLPTVKIQSVDNYISAFGNTLVGNTVDGTANIFLLNQPGNPFPPSLVKILDGEWANSAHGYPITWYEGTVSNPSVASTAGYNWSIVNPSATSMPTGLTYYMQSPTSEFDLFSISASDAQTIMGERNATVGVLSPLAYEALLNINGLTAPIQTENRVSATLVNQSTPEIILTKQAQVSGSATPGAEKSASAVISADAPSMPSSSYAWLPIAVPGNAQYMSLDFTYEGLSPGDFLSVGVDDTMLFALESEFVTDGVTNNTGLLDVSQWAGEDEELFLGLNAVDDNNEGGTVVVTNIEFEGVPEPTAFAIMCASSLVLMRRNRRHQVARAV